MAGRAASGGGSSRFLVEVEAKPEQGGDAVGVVRPLAKLGVDRRATSRTVWNEAKPRVREQAVKLLSPLA